MSHTLNDASATAKIAVRADAPSLARLSGAADGPLHVARQRRLTLLVLLVLWQARRQPHRHLALHRQGPARCLDIPRHGAEGGSHRAQMFPLVGQTLLDAWIGFVVGMIVAIVLAIAFSLSKAIEAGVMPLVLLLRTIPLVSIAPVIILITGRGTPASVAVIGTSSFSSRPWPTCCSV
jgi:ABC-type nitrate/sulfonate/bicarbonate transport system permease component